MQSLYSLILNRLRNTYWILPAAIVIAAILLAIQITWIDSLLNLSPDGRLGWLIQNNPEGARAVLSTIAGSMITVAGVMLSSTIVVLTLASQQFGPRLVRNFIKDRPSQIVVGAFTGCFIYNILILKNIRSGDSDFVPQIALIFGVLQAILCIGLMIYFIQHISTTIQVQSIMDRVKCELDLSIERLYPKAENREPSISTENPKPESSEPSPSTRKVGAQRAGYIQAIRYDALLERCEQHNATIRIHAIPGSFVIEDEPIFSISGQDEPGKDTLSELRSFFIIGTFPTSEQDILFPIQQLEEMAIRALSPGINDPRTAIECVDHLTASLSILAKRPPPTEWVKDRHQKPRIHKASQPFDYILREAFQQIHHHGCTDIQVVLRILKVLHKLLHIEGIQPDYKAPIQSLIDELYEKSIDCIQHSCDREKLSRFYSEIRPHNETNA